MKGWKPLWHKGFRGLLFLRLQLDPHLQLEIRVFAGARMSVAQRASHREERPIYAIDVAVSFMQRSVVPLFTVAVY